MKEKRKEIEMLETLQKKKFIDDKMAGLIAGRRIIWTHIIGWRKKNDDPLHSKTFKRNRISQGRPYCY